MIPPCPRPDSCSRPRLPATHARSGGAARDRLARSRRLAAAMAFAVVASTSALAAAQSKAAPTATAPAASAAPADDVATWFAKGSAAHEAGRFAEAEELFLKVWAVKKAWDVAANLGLAQVNLGKNAAAAEHLSYALRWFPASEPAATKAVLERRLVAARAEVGAVKVTVDVDGAAVRVNGEAKGATPLDAEVFVAAGAVTVEVQKDGYEPATRSLDLAKGAAADVTFTMTAQAAPERSKVPAYVAGGLGLAGVIAGGALLGVAEAQKADLAGKLPRDASGNLVCVRTPPDASSVCPSLRAQATQLDAFGNGGIAALAVGGVVVAGAVAYYFWPTSKQAPAKTASRLVPVAGREGGGLLWIGSF